MFYTDIQELKGLDTPVDYGSGIEYAGALAQAFPESGIQIGLWLNGTQGCRDIVSGVLDNQIHQLYSILDKLDVPKVFLRVGYGTNILLCFYSTVCIVKKVERSCIVRIQKRHNLKCCFLCLRKCRIRQSLVWILGRSPGVSTGLSKNGKIL
jgi:hypothetical protein